MKRARLYKGDSYFQLFIKINEKKTELFICNLQRVPICLNRRSYINHICVI